MQFLIDNFYQILYILIMWSMAPEVALFLVVVIPLLGTPPLWVYIGTGICGSSIYIARFNMKHRDKNTHFTFRFENNDEGE